MTDRSEAEARRTELDSMGSIEVPADRYWGAQTQRSLLHFAIGDQRMPIAVVRALGLVKVAAARVNARLGVLAPDLADVIERAAREVADGRFDAEFPLSVWQTGSGTQTNMNVNEVVAARANELLGHGIGGTSPVHPNDHVNRSQSSNDTFPTAMHVATTRVLIEDVLPPVRALRATVAERAERWARVVKIGRTHLQDAVPLTVGQEWSAWAAQLDHAIAGIEAALPAVHRLAIGGTAVGTGLNAPAGFGGAVADELSVLTGAPFTQAENLFAALAGEEAMVGVSAALRGLAVVLHKVAEDVRWLGSGPRSGLGELRLPENEPGSSIMPGKVNPTQSEALIMVSVQVLALDGAVATAGALGHFQLNTMRPLIAYDVLTMAGLLAGGCDGFRRHCIEGVELDEARIGALVEQSLMLVTALSPAIGYNAAAAIAHEAHVRGITLREAAVASGQVTAERFDELVDPRRMIPGL